MPAEEVGSLLRAYVAEIPDAVIREIDVRPELLGYAGPQAVGPSGVLSRMIFEAVTRASYTACLTWFQSLDWDRASRLLRGPTRRRRP